MSASIDLKRSLESSDQSANTPNSNPTGLSALGAELVFVADASGQYLSFFWQGHSSISNPEVSERFSPGDREELRSRIEKVLERQTPDRYHCLFTADEPTWFELVITPLLQLGGTPDRVLITGVRSPQTENFISPPAPDFYPKLFQQIAQTIHRTLDLDTIWQQTVKILGSSLKVSRCIICSYKPNPKLVQVEAEYCQEPFSSMLAQQLDLEAEPYLEQALSVGDPVSVEQIAQSIFEQQSVLVVSTSYQDQPNGLISLQQCDRRRQWSAAEIELLRELADQVGTAIAHATLYKELEEARIQAEAASRLKSEFLANMTHELRTPLNGIIGFLKLIIEGMVDTPEEQSEFLDAAHRSALHLLDIINDILDIAKIEAGKMEIEGNPIKLDELFNDLENLTRSMAQQKNLSLHIEKPATDDEIIVYGNYQRLLQVMLNLVGNAIKFTHEGGVTISTEVVKKKKTFKGQEIPGFVKVQVADTGIGVALDQQDKLFQNFTQVDGSRTRQFGGTGLGLAISDKLVEAMGGTVNFYSMGEGLGSTVTFTIPLNHLPVMINAQGIGKLIY